MSQPPHLLRLNVGFIANQPIGYNRDFDFDCPTLTLNPDFSLVQFHGTANISRTPQGLLVQADFTADTPVECVRCLETFDQALQTHFDDLYAFNINQASESGLLYPEDGNIDLEPLVRDYLILEIPIGPICQPACKGLCAECGANLNRATCEHATLEPAKISFE